MIYNVRITTKSNPSWAEIKLDLSEENLHDRFITPYENRNPIVINGKTIQLDDLERIDITKNELDSSQILPIVKAARKASRVAVAIPDEWYVADKGIDVTDELIQGPPGYKSTSTAVTEEEDEDTDNKIFIVHGHDAMVKYELELFLREIGLNPIVLHREANEGNTIIEKFEKYGDVSYAFILLTPDDIAYQKIEGEKPDDEREIEFRARQNVIFEFGYFIGKLGRNRVCCLYKPGTALPTDIQGLLYKQVTGTIEQIGYDLIKEIKAAGYELNL